MIVKDATYRVNEQELRAFTQAVFERAGLTPEDAGISADNLVDADLTGVHSHGVMRIPWYAGGIMKGAINLRPNIQRLRRRRCSGLLDGDNGMGQVVAYRAMEWAIEMAQAEGVGTVAVNHSNHFGAAALFARMALKHDFIGIAMTNSGPLMAPWGGKERMLGNHPIAFAIPAGEELPVVLDIATSVAAFGKIQLAAMKGELIPDDWAMDKEGRPTTDANTALQGLVSPLGGYKGYGLSLVVGVLSAVLSGAAFGWEMLKVPGQQMMQGVNVGHFLMAVDVENYIDRNEFKGHMDDIIRHLKNCPRIEGVERIYLPGEPELLKEQQYRSEGVPVSGAVLDELRKIAGELGVKYPWSE